MLSLYGCAVSSDRKDPAVERSGYKCGGVEEGMRRYARVYGEDTELLIQLQKPCFLYSNLEHIE